MAKYRKKPVVIEAYQTDKEFDIETLDWIITGVHGERYPCKPDIFEQTYEKVEPFDPHKHPVGARIEAGFWD